MKHIVKPKRRRSQRRNLFGELTEGMKALAEARLGKTKLRSHSMKLPSGPRNFVTLLSRDSMKIAVNAGQSIQIQVDQ